MKLKNVFLLLIGITLFAAVVRLVNISHPPGYYFDEQYHVPAAKLAQQNDPRLFEWWQGSLQEDPDCIKDISTNSCINNYDWLHPPLGKYFQAVSMSVFGENEIGWRMSSVVFGVLVVVATYGLAQALFDNYLLSLVASFFVAIDGLMLTQSRIAMNDIQLTLWILLGVWAYVAFRNALDKQWYLLLSGVLLGCAVATKWSGIFVVLGIIFFEIYRLIGVAKSESKKLERPVSSQYYFLAKLHWMVFSLLFMPFMIYLFAYIPLFMQGKSVQYFIEYHQQIIAYQLSGAGQHPYASHPSQWMTNTTPVLYWRNQTASIFAFGNPALHLFGISALLASFVYLYKQYIHKKKNVSLKRLLFLLILYFTVWLPWVFTPRILFLYHYTPAVPLLAIIIAYWLIKIKKDGIALKGKFISGKVVFVSIIVAVCISFIFFYPYWTGLPVSKLLGARVYFVNS